jgi:hypothetical protein
MRGTLFVLVATVGAMLGAAVTYSFMRPPSSAYSLPSVADDDGDTHRGASDAASPAARSSTADRADLYHIAAAADAAELAALIRTAAQRTPSAERTFTLNVLLTRYAELDPKAAVAAAAGFDAELRAPLYAAWAMADPASALAALAAIEDRAVARTIAAALVPALGGDDHAVREVAAAVPFGVESSVWADALTARASAAPASAFRQAIALTDLAARSQALEGIAQRWALLDARAAIATADEISDSSVRQPFLAYVARVWARSDPDASLAYLKSLGPNARPDVLMPVGLQVAQMRPREILELVNSLGTPASMSLRMTAIQTLANQDPSLALREADTLPTGGQRENVLAMIARSYGARDPDAALEWARASGDSSRMSGVLQGIAQRDPARAFDLAVALESPQQRALAVQSVVMTAGLPTAGNATAIADRVLALADAELRSNTLRSMLGMWSGMAPDAAAEWLMAHQISDVPGSYQQVAQQLARNNPTRATDYTTRVPPAARSEWIQGVAAGFAQTDPQAATEWLAQYRGDPVYSRAVGSVAAGLALTDAPAAARLLATATDPTAATQGAYVVAMQWAQRDPHAAATWAADYDASANQHVVPNVVGIWAQADAPAARAWTLRMPSGAARDAALGTLLSSTLAIDNVDTALLNAFSSPQVHDQAVVNASMRLRGSDRAAATRFLDRYVTDERLREQAKRNLEIVQPNVMYEFNNGVRQFRIP